LGDGVKVKIGCCGLPGGMKRYFQEFEVVELNSTFYKLPILKTVERWRGQAPAGFEWAVKCWQGVTHPTTSPTWRRSGLDLTGKERYGFLQPSREVFDAWARTLEICEALKARVCLIQLPARFKEEEKNVQNARKFFSKVERGGLEIALELRGWSDQGFRGLCEEFDLISCVDPFAREPLHFGAHGIAYFRLHGSPPGKQMYGYKYTESDLRWLRQKISKLRAREAWVLFNNVWMREDALAFAKLLR